MFIIDLNFSIGDSTSWVLDTRCTSHIYNNLQVLKNRRMLNKNEVELCLRNGAKVAAIAMGSVDLKTTSGGNIPLERCYFVPNIIKNIIFISYLAKIGFKLVIENNSCLLYNDENLVIIGYISNGLYVLDTSPDVLTVDRPIKRKREKVNHTFL